MAPPCKGEAVTSDTKISNTYVASRLSKFKPLFRRLTIGALLFCVSDRLRRHELYVSWMKGTIQ